MNNPDNLRKLADCVEVLREVEGVRIEYTDIAEMPVPEDKSGEIDVLSKIFGGGDPAIEERLVIVLDPTEGEKQETTDDPDEKGLGIEVGDGTEVPIQ